MRKIFNTKLDNYRKEHPTERGLRGSEYMGFFRIPYLFMPGKKLITIMSTGPKDLSQSTEKYLWEHVSISLPMRCPEWEEMCWVKNLFWDEEETVIQFHPPKSKYVNVGKYVLHLWKPPYEVPLPPPITLA